MPKVGTTRAYRYYADRFYLDRANRDNYIARDSATRIALSGGLLLAGALDLGTNLINNLTDPSGNQDADTKAARDAAIAVHAALFTLHNKVVRKAADGDPVNNSTTLVNDPELLFAIAANEVWEFELLAIINSSAVADIKFQFTGPAGSSIYRFNVGESAAATDFISATEPGGAAIDVRGQGIAMINAILEGIIINGATAGNLQVQWAQNTAEVSDTKVLANSLLIAHKIA